MQKFFDLRSLAFYGATIGFVVILFSVATDYGESNLRAPTKIAGRYRIAAQDLPGCLKAETLILTIEQSGIYVNGSLFDSTASEQTQTAAKKRPSLSGLWQQQQLELSGEPSELRACQDDVGSIVKLQGTLNQTALKGQLSLSLIPGSVSFVAQPEEPPKQVKE